MIDLGPTSLLYRNNKNTERKFNSDPMNLAMAQ